MSCQKVVVGSVDRRAMRRMCPVQFDDRRFAATSARLWSSVVYAIEHRSFLKLLNYTVVLCDFLLITSEMLL